jgi:hypothetical protein
LKPPSASALPAASTVKLALSSAPIGAQTVSEMMSARRMPVARSMQKPSTSVSIDR